jgi:metacaspase-1
MIKVCAIFAEHEYGHKGPYLPLIFEACGEDEYAYEYRDGVTSYGAFTYFLTKALFDAGHRKKRFKFQELTEQVADRIAVYYQQTPQLVGPKVWRRAFIPWRARVQAFPRAVK